MLNFSAPPPPGSMKESHFGEPVGPEGTKAAPASAGDPASAAAPDNDGGVTEEMRKAMLKCENDFAL